MKCEFLKTVGTNFIENAAFGQRHVDMVFFVHNVTFLINKFVYFYVYIDIPQYDNSDDMINAFALFLWFFQPFEPHFVYKKYKSITFWKFRIEKHNKSFSLNSFSGCNYLMEISILFYKNIIFALKNISLLWKYKIVWHLHV